MNEYPDRQYYDFYDNGNVNYSNNFIACSGSYNDDREQQAHLLTPANIQNEINHGRTGHYYRTRLAGFGEMITIRLLSLNPSTGRVGMNVYVPRQRQWVYYQEHHKDMYGLIYLGPELSQMGAGGSDGHGRGTPPRPCPSAQFPWRSVYR